MYCRASTLKEKITLVVVTIIVVAFLGCYLYGLYGCLFVSPFILTFANGLFIVVTTLMFIGMIARG